VIALEVSGRALSSHDLAQLVGRAEDGSVLHLVFLIGGAYGLPPRTSQAADQQISLSQLTLPHRLARLVLVEQLYRAFTILRGEPYSH
jgi:23S rRNA (pseudouridine1915-N3)-methyltransferase